MDKREVKIFLADIENNVPFQNNKKVDSKKSILHIFKNNILSKAFFCTAPKVAVASLNKGKIS